MAFFTAMGGWIVDHRTGPHPLSLLEWPAPALGLEDLRPGGRTGVVVPALREEPEGARSRRSI
ncbi:hypothetical protein GCM10010377_67160 [Streptomyces viridiviolaceus]|uniref:Uncharacterized protein n=1 Tax=Streptomyces viridiviolaceus TaxID=68282 RepID=A0ABW2EAY7_9ACTN|nr:hypothetical protein [Streptomyces viridiviolaceus]GHB66826.1 hypothetical protein GCM10010377_67160 [Streptomyces viridiviolaceus]